MALRTIARYFRVGRGGEGRGGGGGGNYAGFKVQDGDRAAH